VKTILLPFFSEHCRTETEIEHQINVHHPKSSPPESEPVIRSVLIMETNLISQVKNLTPTFHPKSTEKEKGRRPRDAKEGTEKDSACGLLSWWTKRYGMSKNQDE
jgi:hypothetical protein